MIKTSPFAKGDMPKQQSHCKRKDKLFLPFNIQSGKKSFLFSVPPKVVPVPPDGQFVVRKGSTITLTCQVSGNPRPKITWQRSVRLFFLKKNRMKICKMFKSVEEKLPGVKRMSSLHCY